MGNKNIISIVNKQTIDSETTNIEVTALGTYRKNNGKHYLTYSDYSSDNKATIYNIKIENPNCLSIIKSGYTTSHLLLEKGKRHYCQYNTEMGPLSMGIYTKNILYEFEKNTGYIHAEYITDINSSVSIINEISINIKENKN